MRNKFAAFAPNNQRLRCHLVRRFFLHLYSGETEDTSVADKRKDNRKEELKEDQRSESTRIFQHQTFRRRRRRAGRGTGATSLKAQDTLTPESTTQSRLRKIFLF